MELICMDNIILYNLEMNSKNNYKMMVAFKFYERLNKNR